MVNVIVLAGTSSKKSKLIDEYDGLGPKNKGLVTVNEQPVVLDILNALQSSSHINQDKIGVVGPKSELENIISNPNVSILQEDSTLFENARKSYNEISKKGEKTLFVNCDVPFFTKETAEEMILESNKYDADLYFALVDVLNIPSETEQLKKSAKLHIKKQGDYRAGNMSIVKGTRIRNSTLIASQVESAFEKRRTTNILARSELYWSLGRNYWKELIIHACKCLSEQRVEYAIKRELGINLKLINIEDPKAAVDIDYQRDYDFIKANYKNLKEILDNY